MNNLSSVKGMTLIELLTAVALVSFISLGSAALIQSNFSARTRAESKRALLTQTNRLQMRLKDEVQSAANCRTVISLPNRVFSASNRNPIQFTFESQNFSDGTIIDDHSAASFRIDRLYLADSTELGSSSSTRTYASNVYLEGSIRNQGDWLSVPKKQVTTLNLRIDSSGALQDCDMVWLGSGEEACKSVTGMRWNEMTGSCVQEIAVESGTFFNCPSGMQMNAAQVCVPTTSACSHNALPRDFDDGFVTGCEPLAATYTVNYPSNFTPPNSPSRSPTGTGPSNPISPTSPTVAPQTCACGNSTIPQSHRGSSTNFCASARKVGNKIGGIDFEGDVEISVYQCDAGNLSLLTTYFDEDSDHYFSGRKPVTCNAYGQSCQL